MPDSETQTQEVLNYTKAVNETVLNDAEAVALGSLYQSVAHAMGLGAMNAVSAQQQNNISAQSVTIMCATKLFA